MSDITADTVEQFVHNINHEMIDKSFDKLDKLFYDIKETHKTILTSADFANNKNFYVLLSQIREEVDNMYATYRSPIVLTSGGIKSIETFKILKKHFTD